MKRVAFLTTINIALIITAGLLAIKVTAADAQRPSPTPTPAAQVSGQLGPNLNQFPAGVNPLTGLPVANADNLDLPAVLVSLANFPPSARPLTGLSFAPQVYEIYITEGMTRFLTVFYGDLPTTQSISTLRQAQGTGTPVAEPAEARQAQGTASPTAQPTQPALIGAFENPGDGLAG